MFRSLLARISLKSYLYGLGVGVLIGIVYVYMQSSTSATTTTTSSMSLVERRSVVNSVKATGTVTFANSQIMKFNTRGTVTKVNVAEGDTVKRGQIIAEIDQTAVLSDIRSAQLGMAASQLQIQQLQNDQGNQLLTAQNSTNDATRQVAQAELDLQKARETELQSTASTAQSILADADGLLDSYYYVLSRNTATRPVQGNFTLTIDPLLYRDLMLVENIRNGYNDAVNTANAMHQKYGPSIASLRDADQILQALNDAKELAHAISSLGENIYTMLQGATTDGITFTATSLNTLRSTSNSNKNTAAGLVSDADTALTNLTASRQNENFLPSITLQQKQDALTTTQESLLSRQSGQANTQESTNISIMLKQNSIAQQAASLQKLRTTLDNYRLIAPFDGVVRQISIQVGDNLLADTTENKTITLENPSYIIVTVPMDQVDIVRVLRKMPATITLDALPGKIFQGAIDDIKPTPIQQSGVVSYQVDVRMPTPGNLNILSGMTATVITEAARSDNALAVPNLAVLTSGGNRSVKKADGTSVEVQTGITDGRYTEILSGLNEGDAVFSMNLPSASSAGTQNAGQIFRLTGGGGGGPPGGGH
ncbi:MAG: efflux RND transporter periplasmic adaptor subunit [Candidatus Peregrinibacteria bacterium]